MDEPFLPAETGDESAHSAHERRRIALTTPDDLRQAAQLPPHYEKTGANEMTFDPRLAFELAVGVASASDTFAKYGVDESRARAFLQDSAFLLKVKQYRAEITESGYGFKLKAKLQAESMLDVAYLLVHDTETPATVRADLVKWMAKMAGFEPATDKDGRGGGGGSFQLNVTFAGAPAASARVIDSTAERIEG